MGSVYQKKGRLYISYKDATGKWKANSTGLRVGQEKRAWKILDDVEAQVEAGNRFIQEAGGKPTVARYAELWIAERKRRELASAGDDAARLKHIVPALAGLKLREVRVRHVRDAMRELKMKIGPAKADLSPRTVLHAYRTLNTMFEEAVADDLMDASPCKLKRHELPKKVDKDPNWRRQAVFTRAEVETLISDEGTPRDRRVFTTILALTGMRFGEVAALRWSAIDTTLEPLSMLSVHCSFDAKMKQEKSVKNEVPRRVPVHPTLAKVLAAWKLGGWEEFMGRSPAADDLVVPSTRGKHRSVGYGRVQFHADLDRLGLRRRRQHDLRRTFISLCRTDGARKDLLSWISHGPSDDIMDAYSTFPWQALCDEVSRLNIELKEGKVIVMPMAAVSGSNQGECAEPFYPLSTLDSKAMKSKGNFAEMHGNRTRRADAHATHHWF